MKIMVEEGVWALVTHYTAPCPMRITGTGFGDAEPPEIEELDFYLVDEHDKELIHKEVTRELEEHVLKEYKESRGIR